MPREWDEWEEEEEDKPRTPDPKEVQAREELRAFFTQHPERVVYGRQLQIMLERRYFHWITDRAVKALAAEGVVNIEVRTLATGGTIHLVYNRRYRYYKRSANEVTALVEEFSGEDVAEQLGHNGELLVQDGFVRHGFRRLGRETRSYNGVEWTQTGHDLDFIFERDGLAYGVEVKNKLGYIDYREFKRKIEICRFIGVRPVFACRMLPTTWINELRHQGGFAWVMGYQLYPIGLRSLVTRIRGSLELPVDCPRYLQQGTTERFERWHLKQLETT